jgi:DUF971 family protein
MASESPKSIKAYREQRVLEVGWNDGSVQRIAFKTLRSECPCAELCGNYALRVEWNDGHSTGLYTWQRLAEIGAGPS